MHFDESCQKNFISEMAENQISARDFFSPSLLQSLERNFGLTNASIICFDERNNFISWIDSRGIQHGFDDVSHKAFAEDDSVRTVIYKDAGRDNLNHMNLEPKVYFPCEMLEDYEGSQFAKNMNEILGMAHCAIMAFGKNAYLEIVCYKSEGEGPFSEEEKDELYRLYTYVARAYKNFKLHEQSKIFSSIQDEIINSGANSYMITDDNMHVLVCNKRAQSYLEEILGDNVSDTFGIENKCSWLPFLLGDIDSTEKVCHRVVRNYDFFIHTFNQTYSHDIIDRYYWITIMPEEEKRKIVQDIAPAIIKEERRDVELTPAEKRVADLICQGLTYKEAASQLGLSYHTVKNQVQKIFNKYQINNKFELYRKHSL